MADSMLEEIWRVRAELIDKHGGREGYYKYVDKVYREHERFARRHKLKPEGPELWEIEMATQQAPSKKNMARKKRKKRKPSAKSAK